MRRRGVKDFLIDVVIGNLPDLTGIDEHPMEFGSYGDAFFFDVPVK